MKSWFFDEFQESRRDSLTLETIDDYHLGFWTVLEGDLVRFEGDLEGLEDLVLLDIFSETVVFTVDFAEFRRSCGSEERVWLRYIFPQT